MFTKPARRFGSKTERCFAFLFSVSQLAAKKKKQSLWVTTKLAPQKLIFFVPPVGIFWEPPPRTTSLAIIQMWAPAPAARGCCCEAKEGLGTTEHLRTACRNLMSWRDLPAQRELMMGC